MRTAAIAGILTMVQCELERIFSARHERSTLLTGIVDILFSSKAKSGDGTCAEDGVEVVALVPGCVTTQEEFEACCGIGGE